MPPKFPLFRFLFVCFFISKIAIASTNTEFVHKKMQKSALWLFSKVCTLSEVHDSTDWNKSKMQQCLVIRLRNPVKNKTLIHIQYCPCVNVQSHRWVYEKVNTVYTLKIVQPSKNRDTNYFNRSILQNSQPLSDSSASVNGFHELHMSMWVCSTGHNLTC